MAYAFWAYLFWGFFPIYWKALDHIPSNQIFAHRVIWSAFCFVCFIYFKKIKLIPRPLTGKEWVTLVTCAALIGSNWWVYLVAVNTNHILDASLGYFISPLISASIGSLILKEKLNWKLKVAVTLAFLGVANMAYRVGVVPTSGLYLAFSFSIYAWLRKKLNYDPLAATTLEALVMTPFALAGLAYLWFVHQPPQGFESQSLLGLYSMKEWILLILGGIVTGLTLWLFNEAGKRLPLSILGMFQYISPTIQLWCGVFLFQEHFDSTKLTSFVLIWIGLFFAIWNLLSQKNE